MFKVGGAGGGCCGSKAVGHTHVSEGIENNRIFSNQPHSVLRHTWPDDGLHYTPPHQPLHMCRLTAGKEERTTSLAAAQAGVGDD